jgi:hypothetical protein
VGCGRELLLEVRPCQTMRSAQCQR